MPSATDARLVGTTITGSETAPADSASRFFAGALDRAPSADRFQVIDRRTLRIDVDGMVWIKRGSVVAYHGDLRFHLEPIVEARRLRRETRPVLGALLREATPFAKAQGTGRLYVSNDGLFNQVLRLDGESIYVASTNLVAFERTLEHEIMTVGSVGLLAGGLLVVKLTGTGLVAFSTRGEPLTLAVGPAAPVSTDPTATVAWTDGLWPELKTDLDLGSLVAHGGGQPIQMRFGGEGHVVVNARSRTEALRAGLLRRLGSAVTRLLG